jgi:putative PEP-CTERM system histidine kinase
MITLAADAAFLGISLLQSRPVDAVYFQRWRHAALALAPGLWLAFALTYARGDRLSTLRKWRFELATLLVIPILLFAINNNGLFADLEVDESGHVLALYLGWTGYAIHLAIVIGAVLILMHLERSFRTSVGTTRWRIKFMLMGAAMIWAAHLYISSQALVFRAIDFSIQGINGIGLFLGCLLILRTIFRTGHFETDLYPSPTVVYGSATLLLAGIYLFVVGILAKVVAFLGGDAGFTMKALLIMVGLVAIALVVQSDRVRVAYRQFASRHFHRPIHDFRSIWQQVTDVTAKAQTVDQLSNQMVELVSKIFEAHSVTHWTVSEHGSTPVLRRTASTGHENLTPSKENPDIIGDPEILRQYGEAQAPFSIETSTQPWAIELRERTPRKFPEFKAPRIALPLTAQTEFLGLVTISDRIGGVAFDPQDLEVLQSVGNQFAARLLNLRLSQRMADARELEAFQTMATFFVHDLKNAISGLRLMARNLETQFENPEFREDAVRAVAKSVDRIEDLIQRMAQLRQKVEINPSLNDLNEIIDASLKRIGEYPSVTITTDLTPLPQLEIDREKIASVLTNLVLNAIQSTEDPVAIHVSSKRTVEGISLSVADNGSGMDAEFIRTRLFQPFQTTKKQGLGIGMFQCKTIIEAHGGRITVESIVGQGTTFQISLPVAEKSEVDGA